MLSLYMEGTIDRHLTICYIFISQNCAVSWIAKKQQTIALGATKVEYLRGREATKENMAFSEGIGYQIKGGQSNYSDNQGANALAENPEYHGRTKHIHSRQRFIPGIVKQKVEYVQTKDMVTETLTKALARDMRDLWV